MTQKPAKKQRLAVRNTYARTLYKPSRYVKPQRYIELKFDDGGPASTTIPAGGLLTLLTTIDNGTGPSARIGSHITYTDIEFNWAVNQSTSNSLPQYARVYLIYDKQVNGAAPTPTTILREADPFSLMAANYRDRFTVMWDSGMIETYYNTAVNVGGAYNTRNACGHKVVSLRGKHCEFNGSGLTVADIVSGGLFFLCVSTVGGIHGFEENNRIQFYD